MAGDRLTHTERDRETEGGDAGGERERLKGESRNGKEGRREMQKPSRRDGGSCREKTSGIK